MFSPTTRTSPRDDASSSKVTCPTCSASKQPFVNTSRLPLLRSSTADLSDGARVLIFSWARGPRPITKRWTSSRLMADVPSLPTAIPAAALASLTRGNEVDIAGKRNCESCDHRVACACHVENLSRDRRDEFAMVPWNANIPLSPSVIRTWSKEYRCLRSSPTRGSAPSSMESISRHRRGFLPVRRDREGSLVLAPVAAFRVAKDRDTDLSRTVNDRAADTRSQHALPVVGENDNVDPADRVG